MTAFATPLWRAVCLTCLLEHSFGLRNRNSRPSHSSRVLALCPVAFITDGVPKVEKAVSTTALGVGTVGATCGPGSLSGVDAPTIVAKLTTPNVMQSTIACSLRRRAYDRRTPNSVW